MHHKIVFYLFSREEILTLLKIRRHEISFRASHMEAVLLQNLTQRTSRRYCL